MRLGMPQRKGGFTTVFLFIFWIALFMNFAGIKRPSSIILTQGIMLLILFQRSKADKKSL